MSAEEDTELRDLVAQTLEANGVLGKIRAQLRASVFIALEEQEKVQNKTPLVNRELQKFLSTAAGCQAVSLVREFLQFFNLEYTLAVFDPEVGCAPERLQCSRRELARQLDVIETAETSSLPLLSSLMKQNRETHGPQQRHSLTEETGGGFGVGDAKLVGVVAADVKPLSALAGRRDSGSDIETDPFFNDLPKKDTTLHHRDETKQLSAVNKPADQSLSSLAGLPALSAGGRMTLTGSSLADNEKPKTGTISLDLDVADDDKYEDDFHSSNISPAAQTPRSDNNVQSLDNEEIDEEIEEQLSDGDDLLKSEASANNDLTTDRTLSPTALSTAADYVEDILHL